MSQGTGLLQRYGGIRWMQHSIRQVFSAWDRFWFEPADPVLLGIIRVLCGWMLFYNLAVWTLDLEAFFGDQGLQPLQAIRSLYASRRVFCFWLWTGDTYLWPIHFACLTISALFCLGIATRITSVLCFLITISYSQRVPVANFGFDQILGLLCLYLCIGPSGAALSVDAMIRRWRLRRNGKSETVRRFSSARVSMRLIQLHLCAIYLWAGLGKLKGPTWWTGEAMWRVLANQEYQTMDLTWMAWVPSLPFFLAHITIVWEVFFIALIWNPRLRPFLLAIGLAMHVGIGAFLGMWTFGLIMAFAYFAFSDPDVWRARLSAAGDWIQRRTHSDQGLIFNTAVANSRTIEATEFQHLVRDPDPLTHKPASEPPSNNVPSTEPATEHQRPVPPVNHASPQICIVAADAGDRSTLRRYLRDHNVACRFAADFNSGLDIVSRYRISAVVVNSTSFRPSVVCNFVADVADLTSLPILVLISPQHKGELTELLRMQNLTFLELPASLREIRRKLHEATSTATLEA